MEVGPEGRFVGMAQQAHGRSGVRAGEAYSDRTDR